MNAIACTTRWLIRRDFAHVIDIESMSAIDPWSEADYLKALREPRVIGMVAEVDDRVVGATVYELCKDRLRIERFIVRAECQRRGVGRQLMTTLIRKLSLERRSLLTIQVPECNLDVQHFVRAMGFRAKRLLRERPDAESAWLMQYKLTEAISP